MKKQERQEYNMMVENKYDLLVRLQEDRGISLGEIAYVEDCNLKDLKGLEEEIDTELERIAKIVKEELYYLIEE